MTLAGFIIAVAVIGVLFYAWYYFVHRNGVYNAAAGNRSTTMRESNRQRPTNSQAAFGTEVGEIGDLEEQKVPAPIRARQQDGTLHNTHYEIGSIGDNLQSQPQQQQNQGFTSGAVCNQMRQDAQQAFNSEVGSIGDNPQSQPQQQQNQGFTSGAVCNQMRQDAQQAFNSEVGSIGEASQPQQQQTSSNAAAMQKYTVEAGSIGDLSLIDGQGNTLLPNNIPGTNGMGYFPPQAVSQQTSDKQQQ